MSRSAPNFPGTHRSYCYEIAERNASYVSSNFFFLGKAPNIYQSNGQDRTVGTGREDNGPDNQGHDRRNMGDQDQTSDRIISLLPNLGWLQRATTKATTFSVGGMGIIVEGRQDDETASRSLHGKLSIPHPQDVVAPWRSGAIPPSQGSWTGGDVVGVQSHTKVSCTLGSRG